MWEEELRLVIAHRYGAVESTVDSESGDLAFALARLKSPVWPTSGPHVLFLGGIHICRAVGTMGKPRQVWASEDCALIPSWLLADCMPLGQRSVALAISPLLCEPQGGMKTL